MSSMARVGEHNMCTRKWVMSMPRAASRSILGVWISLPITPMSEYPMSSARMTRKLGRSARSAVQAASRHAAHSDNRRVVSRKDKGKESLPLNCGDTILNSG